MAMYIEEGDEQMTTHMKDYPILDDSEEDEIETSSPSLCLFCPVTCAVGLMTLRHMTDYHRVPFFLLLQSPDFDFYSFVKIVNYFRKHKSSESDYQTVESLRQLTTTLDQSYMIPVCEEDGLLQFDVEEYQEAHPQQSSPARTDSSVTLSSQEYNSLKRTALQFNQLRCELENLKEKYYEDISQLRASAQRLISSGKLESVAENGDAHIPPANSGNTSQVHSLNDAEDDSYIGSYSHYSIHMDMLQDKVRTDGYRQAIVNNRDMFRDKVVLDVGCGTGVLSMFAATAGAKHVYAVDMSDIIYQAMDIVRENGMEERITLLKGRMEEVKLPVESVDIIVSEWMGYFLLFESMLDSVIFARNKWLSSDGLVWPNRCDILLTASSDSGLRDKNIAFWDDVYGYSMSCMKEQVCKEGLVQIVKSEHLVTPPVIVKTVDCCTSNISQLDFTSSFNMAVESDCTVHALIGYFDTFFSHQLAASKVTFSTGPHSPPTHWKQTVFLLATPLHRKQGEHITGSIDVRKAEKDPRSLQVTISIDSFIHKYILS